MPGSWDEPQLKQNSADESSRAAQCTQRLLGSSAAWQFVQVGASILFSHPHFPQYTDPPLILKLRDQRERAR